MIKNKKLIIFDLDGVLIDSIFNMKSALKSAGLSLNLRLNFKEYQKYIGLPFEEIMKKMGIKTQISLIKQKYIFFSKKNLKYVEINKENCKILKKLKKKFKLAIFTSKDAKRTKSIISKYKLFDYILTSDDIKKGKPNPSGLKKIIKFFKLRRVDAVYIGDSYYDYKCAKNAKVKYYHALWGYHKLKSYKSIHKIKSMRELLNLI